jgi:hypothetical protein
MTLKAEQSNSGSDLKMTLLLEPLISGGVAASVLEFPACRVEAATRELAIAQVRQQIVALLNTVELLPIQISAAEITQSQTETENPWIKFAGMFQDDPDFAKIAAAIRAEREVDDNTEVDPAVYRLED